MIARTISAVTASTLLAVMLTACAHAGGAPTAPTTAAATKRAVATGVDPRSMTFEPVAFVPPTAERVVLENGMVVYLLEDHELPLVSLQAMMRVGSWLDPEGKDGLAEVTGQLMRTGGSSRQSAQEIDQTLEQIAASIGISIGDESGSASLDVLKKDLGTGLKMLADLLRTPAFESDRLELLRLEGLESIRRRQDQPAGIAAREFARLVYGPTHPYARESSVQSVKAITRDDVVAFHRAHLHPNGIVLGVSGDFEKAELLRLLREVFGDWAKGEVPTLTLPPVPAPPTGAAGKLPVYYVGKETSQAHLRVGQLTLKENDPDYPAFAIVNDILGGGGFRSRLFKDVRTNRGLAYSVGSRIQSNVRERSLWTMRAETKLASAQEVVGRFLANMERMRAEPVSDAELAEAKDAFVNAFVFSFANSGSIVARLIDLEYDGLPRDWLQQLRDKIVRLTKDDIQRVAQRVLDPAQVRVLAVGAPQGLSKALAGFGDVREIKLPPEG
ncbi:MAG: pitrilysin family protein [Nitrospiraceae bacterium]